VSIGPYSSFFAVNGSSISIGNCTVIAAYCYTVGGANYGTERTDIPMIRQDWKPGKGIRIGSDVWLGGSVVIVDGVTIGDGSIIGAQSMVNKDIPEYSVAFGAPAKVHHSRRE